MIRVWYKIHGTLDSCKIDVATKTEARKVMKEVLPSARLGLIQKVSK